MDHQPQPVVAPLTRAAIFLVVTVNPGADHRATVRGFCEDFPALVRAVAFRDLEGYLSCVAGFGSTTWDQVFGAARPASTLIGVNELAIPGMKVEIEAVVGLKR